MGDQISGIEVQDGEDGCIFMYFRHLFHGFLVKDVITIIVMIILMIIMMTMILL